MAEGDVTIPNEFKRALMAGEIDLDGHTFKMALVHTITPDIDTHANWADVSANECAGTGYTAGGEVLTSLAVTKDLTNDRAAWDFADVTWTNILLTTPADATPDYAVVYDDTHVNKVICCFIELGRATNGGDYTVQINAAGMMTLS